MRNFFVILCSVFLMCFIFAIPNASAYNVALGADVSLSGNPFFTEYLDWGSTGSPASQALIDSIVDGEFLPTSTQWDQGTLWWDEHSLTGGPGLKGYITIDLGGTFSIDSFIMQADDNDSYQISYLDSGTLEWTVMDAVGGWGMQTRPEVFLPDPVVTSMLQIEAISGDGWYSVSEVQAMGAPVPEPSTMMLIGVGLLSFTALRRKMFRDGT